MNARHALLAEWSYRASAHISAMPRKDIIFFSIFYKQYNKPKNIKCGSYYNFYKVVIGDS